jgi:hypothetical protein
MPRSITGFSNEFAPRLLRLDKNRKKGKQNMWLILESGQTAINTDNVISFGLEGIESDCSLYANMLDTTRYRIKRFVGKNFDAPEAMVADLVSVLELAGFRSPGEDAIHVPAYLRISGDDVVHLPCRGAKWMS